MNRLTAGLAGSRQLVSRFVLATLLLAGAPSVHAETGKKALILSSSVVGGANSEDTVGAHRQETVRRHSFSSDSAPRGGAPKALYGVAYPGRKPSIDR